MTSSVNSSSEVFKAGSDARPSKYATRKTPFTRYKLVRQLVVSCKRGLTVVLSNYRRSWCTAVWQLDWSSCKSTQYAADVRDCCLVEHHATSAVDDFCLRPVTNGGKPLPEQRQFVQSIAELREYPGLESGNEEGRLKWSGHAERKDDAHWVRLCMTMDRQTPV